MRLKPPDSPKFQIQSAWMTLVVVWIGVVFFLFFSHLYHSWPPFPLVFDSNRFPNAALAQRLQVWGGSLWDLFVGLWITGLLWNTGRRLRKWFFLSIPSFGVRFCFDWILGLFLMNLFWMGLGLVRLWFDPIGWAALLGLTFFLLRDLLSLRKKNPSFAGLKGKFPLWALVAPLYFLFLLAHCLLPETFYDSLNYFLGMPSFWLFRHGISDNPTHLLSGYFHGGSLFFMNGFVLSGTEGAKVLNATVLAWIALLAASWIREIAGFPAAVAAGVAVSTFPLLYLNSWAVRVDGLLTLTLLLFFYGLEKAVQHSRRKKAGPAAPAWTLATGILAGLALSIKPTAVVGISAAFLACLWQGEWGFFKNKKTGLILAGCGLLEVGPWLLKNALFTGNAFFPYAISWMGGRQFPHQGYERLLGENRQFLPMDHGLWSVLTLPWRLTLPQWGDGQFIGPLLLAFLPVFLVLRPSNGSLRFLAKTMALSFLLGLGLSHMLRFSMPAFVLALMVLSALLAADKRKGWGMIWVVSVAACAVLCFGKYVDLSAGYYDGAGIWSGKEGRESYLDRKLLNSYEPLARWTGDHLPAEAELLIVGDARGVYYRRPYYANSAFDAPFLAEAARREKGPEGILRRLRELGVTYLAVNIPEGLRTSKDYRQYELRPEEWKRLNEFLAGGLEPVYWKDFLAVYRIRPRLSATPGPYVANPFSFFCPAAYDFINDFETGNYPRAEEESGELLGLFPKEAYWWEKRALLEAARGKAPEAFRDFRRADSLGGLTAEGYREWAAFSEASRNPVEARRARQKAERAYPGLFKDARKHPQAAPPPGGLKGAVP